MDIDELRDKSRKLAKSNIIENIIILYMYHNYHTYETAHKSTLHTTSASTGFYA